MTASKAITEEEAQLYDRQIRLWGLDAQKRLRASRVLVAGIKGLGCEVVKNLVLAGINSLTMIDHENLTKEDTDSQFLAPRDKIGSVIVTLSVSDQFVCLYQVSTETMRCCKL